MNKNKRVYLIISTIVIVVLSISMFLLWAEKNGSFWITYIFSLIAILSISGNSVSLQPNNHQFASNFTLMTISIVYLVLNVLCSIIFLTVIHASNMVYLVAHIIVLAIFLIIWLLGFLAVQHINKQDK